MVYWILQRINLVYASEFKNQYDSTDSSYASTEDIEEVTLIEPIKVVNSKDVDGELSYYIIVSDVCICHVPFPCTWLWKVAK